MTRRAHHSPLGQLRQRRTQQTRRRQARVCTLESLEQRQLLASDFQNPANAYDVTLDGFVAPIDALNVINDLNLNGARDLREPGVVLPVRPLDVDGDNFIIPLDALMIINLLNLDIELPALFGDLQNDTGVEDRITFDSTVTGKLISLTDQRQVTAQVDGGDPVGIDLDPLGKFSFDATTFPGGVADGAHTFHLEATDREGTASLDVSFSIDTTPAAVDSFGLHPDSDTAPIGDGRTEQSLVALVGMTEPSIEVHLVQTDELAMSDATGHFEFANVSLAFGNNTFTLLTTDATGNVSSPSDFQVTRYDPSGAPVVSAELLNDTGIVGDALSSDIRIAGDVSSSLEVARVLTRLEESTSDEYFDITSALQQDNTFQLSVTFLADLLGSAIDDRVYHLQLLAEDSDGNVSEMFVLPFERDTAAPVVQAYLDDAAAMGLTTSSSTTTISGQSEPGAQLLLTPGNLPVQADDNGLFSILDVALSAGTNQFELLASDAAANTRSLPLQITRTTATGLIELATSDSLVSEQGWIVDLGQLTGVRKLAFQVDANVAESSDPRQLGDRLLVYLLDPQDPREPCWAVTAPVPHCSRLTPMAHHMLVAWCLSRIRR